MKTILLTGGAGFIGSHAAKAAKAAGYLPVVYDNLSRGYEEAARYGPLEVGDVRDTPRLAEAMRRHGVEAVMHFAAFINVGESVEKPELYFDNNVGGVMSLLDAMREAGVRSLVFSSTCALYGTPADPRLTEDTPFHPESPYGETKAIAERLIHWETVCHGLRAMCLRYFNAAGCDPDGEIGESHQPETHLIPNLLDAALGFRDPCPLFGRDYPTRDGTCVRDYIHVSDLAAAHIAALRYLEGGGMGAALNLGSETGYSVAEVLTHAERILGKRVPVVWQDRRAGDPPSLTANSDRARRMLGWSCSNSDLDTILRTALAWRDRAHRRNTH